MRAVRGVLSAAVVALGVGIGACGLIPQKAPECPTPDVVAIEEEPEAPLKMIVLVYPDWEFPAEDVRLAYVLLIGEREVVQFTGEEYRQSDGLQALVDTFDTWASPIPVRRITLDVVRKESI